MLCFIMTIGFFAWLLLNLLHVEKQPEGFLFPLILLQYMQGLLVVLVLFGHNYGKKVIEKRRNKNKSGNHEMQNGNHEIIPLNDLNRI